MKIMSTYIFIINLYENKSGHYNHIYFNIKLIYLPRYYVTYPSIVKMNGLLSFCNVEVYKRLSLFINKIAGMF